MDYIKVKDQYESKNPFSFIEMESFPSCPNSNGDICLINNSLTKTIDAFTYSEEMHFSLLDNVEGVSLNLSAM